MCNIGLLICEFVNGKWPEHLNGNGNHSYAPATLTPNASKWPHSLAGRWRSGKLCNDIEKCKTTEITQTNRNFRQANDTLLYNIKKNWVFFTIHNFSNLLTFALWRQKWKSANKCHAIMPTIASMTEWLRDWVTN